MLESFFKQIGLMLLLLTLQVLVFNHVNIFGYATPLICIYFILTLPAKTPIWQKLVWAFVIGLLQDMFASTPGMTSASLVLVAFCHNWLLTFFGDHNTTDEADAAVIPSLRTLGQMPFLRYTVVAVFMQNTVFYLLETFSFFSFFDLLANIIGSTLLTSLIVWGIDSIRQGNRKKDVAAQ